MTSLAQRRQIVGLVDQAVRAGARQRRACETIFLSLRTLQRWRGAPWCGDRRPDRVQTPKNHLSAVERERVLAVANSEEFGGLAPSQIVPRLADHGQYLACESTKRRTANRRANSCATSVSAKRLRLTKSCCILITAVP